MNVKLTKIIEAVHEAASDSYENGWRDAFRLMGREPSVADLHKMREGRERNADATVEGGRAS